MAPNACANAALARLTLPSKNALLIMTQIAMKNINTHRITTTQPSTVTLRMVASTYEAPSPLSMLSEISSAPIRTSVPACACDATCAASQEGVRGCEASCTSSRSPFSPAPMRTVGCACSGPDTAAAVLPSTSNW
jgi:hypothetical protein